MRDYEFLLLRPTSLPWCSLPAVLVLSIFCISMRNLIPLSTITSFPPVPTSTDIGYSFELVLNCVFISCNTFFFVVAYNRNRYHVDAKEYGTLRTDGQVYRNSETPFHIPGWENNNPWYAAAKLLMRQIMEGVEGQVNKP